MEVYFNRTAFIRPTYAGKIVQSAVVLKDEHNLTADLEER
jgi:hypothetical protein